MHAVHNARVQLAATAFNNLASAPSWRRFAPIGTDHVTDWQHVASWVYFAAGLFAAGHFMLR